MSSLVKIAVLILALEVVKSEKMFVRLVYCAHAILRRRFKNFALEPRIFRKLEKVGIK